MTDHINKVDEEHEAKDCDRAKATLPDNLGVQSVRFDEEERVVKNPNKAQLIQQL